MKGSTKCFHNSIRLIFGLLSLGQTPANIVFELSADLMYDWIPDQSTTTEDYVWKLGHRLTDLYRAVRTEFQFEHDRMKTRYDQWAESGGLNEGDVDWMYNQIRRKNKSQKLQSLWVLLGTAYSNQVQTFWYSLFWTLSILNYKSNTIYNK